MFGLDELALPLDRRSFLGAAAGGLAALAGCREAREDDREVIIDIHQHTSYSGRSDDDLIAHQRRMGISQTVLLPAGSKYGLAAGCGGNDTVAAVASRLPGEFVFFANELPDIPETRAEITRWLDAGAIGIGEQKFPVASDSAAIAGIAEIAREYRVPVLLHFQHEAYNFDLARFRRILEKFPGVDFIGHAQTWWGHIDARHDEAVLYPKGPVTPGGLTDRLLADYPNMYGDLSAGSGLNALLRDEAHAAAFLVRHQDKLMYGSDCNDTAGFGDACQGAQTISAIRSLAPDRRVRAKIFAANARRVMKLP